MMSVARSADDKGGWSDMMKVDDEPEKKRAEPSEDLMSDIIAKGTIDCYQMGCQGKISYAEYAKNTHRCQRCEGHKAFCSQDCLFAHYDAVHAKK
jgi:hypothetical protein